MYEDQELQDPQDARLDEDVNAEVGAKPAGPANAPLAPEKSWRKRLVRGAAVAGLLLALTAGG
jgi:hypothetical protein